MILSQSLPDLEFTDQEVEALVDTGEIAELILAELKRRLVEGNAKDLPGTGLMQFANQVIKLREKEMERETANQESVSVDPVDIILDSPLPDNRKQQQFEALKAFHLDQIERIKNEQTLLRGES